MGQCTSRTPPCPCLEVHEVPFMRLVRGQLLELNGRLQAVELRISMIENSSIGGSVCRIDDESDGSDSRKELRRPQSPWPLDLSR